MNYDHLSVSYWQEQVERVNSNLQQINDRSTVASGRVVPESTDLALGTGRRLDMTVMFLDISGFSDRPSEFPNEQQQIKGTFCSVRVLKGNYLSIGRKIG